MANTIVIAIVVIVIALFVYGVTKKSEPKKGSPGGGGKDLKHPK